MFEDNRGKKVILLAHCLLNQNSISDGTADFPGQFLEILKIIEENNIGIIQLPCPELMCLGLSRKDELGSSRNVLEENSRIRVLLEEYENKRKISELVESIVYQVREYKKYGFEIVGLVGINRSPSCGVETTTVDNIEQEGRGVFFDLLVNELSDAKISINSIGVKTSRIDESIKKIKQLVCG